MTIFKYALMRGIRNPLSMIVNCIIPLALIFVRPLWADGSMAGLAFLGFAIMNGAFLMSQSILTDKIDGAITRILAAPITMRRYLAENLLSCMAPVTIQMLLVSLLGFILYDWSLTLSIAIFLCYTVLTMSVVGMAFAWHCLFKTKEASSSGFAMVIMCMAMLSGMLIPTEILPGILEHIGVIFPAYWATQGINAVQEAGVFNADFWLAIAAMLLFTTAFLLYGGKRRII